MEQIRSFIKGITGLEQITQLTGEPSPNHTDRYAVYGTDLGSMMNDGERTYFVFGDTFGEREPGQTGGGGSYWRSNTMAYTTDAEAADGITFEGMVTDEFGTAKELPLRQNRLRRNDENPDPRHCGRRCIVFVLHVGQTLGDPGSGTPITAASPNRLITEKPGSRRTSSVGRGWQFHSGKPL